MSKIEYSRRRKKLMRQMSKDSIAIIPAASMALRNRDVEHTFRQDSDFHYLTGFNEPEALAIIAPKHKMGEYILFCRERDPAMETWTGSRTGIEGAQTTYGASAAFPYSEIDQQLPKLLEGCQRIYYTLGNHRDFDFRISHYLKQLRDKSRAGTERPTEIFELDQLLHEMRLFKTPQEINIMRQAAKISAQGHKQAMQMCQPGLYEYEIAAEIHRHFERNGCDTAYGSIVGGGANGCVLHYVDNNKALNDGDLLLIDAGAEKAYYASDITRTFPVNGRFSEAQKSIYKIVLDAQEAAIQAVKPGNHWNQPHEAAVKVITKELIKLGLLKGSVAKLIKDGSYRQFYMHRTGHWLGMDVHDVGDYKQNGRWRKFQPGMALTIEPGIYIPAGSKKVAKKWWNIGIRIEDDVVVTSKGCDILSKDVPKTVTEIEQICNSVTGNL